MSQTSATAAALVIAFLIFITVRGELPAYFGAFGIGPKPETAAPQKAVATLTSYVERFGGASPSPTVIVNAGGGGGGPVGGPGGGDPCFGDPCCGDPLCGGGYYDENL